MRLSAGYLTGQEIFNNFTESNSLPREGCGWMSAKAGRGLVRHACSLNPSPPLPMGGNRTGQTFVCHIVAITLERGILKQTVLKAISLLLNIYRRPFKN